MPRIRKMEIVGEGMQPNGKVVTREMLDSVVRNYNPDSRPPITLGHPKKGDDQMAALGRAANLRTGYDDKGKYVLMGELYYTPELEALEDSGKFEGQSAGIHPVKGKDGEWRLHHIAQLGQLPPGGDIKTKDVVELSDDDFGDDVIYLSAHVGNKTNDESNVMKFEQLIALIEGCDDEQKKQLADKLGIKAAPAPKPKDKDNPEPKKSDTPEGGESEAVKKLQDAMANDRKTALKELLSDESRDIADEQKKVFEKSIDSATTVELCDNGDSSFFAMTKALITSAPTKSSSASTAGDEWGDLLNGVHLSDDGKGETNKPFDMEGF